MDAELKAKSSAARTDPVTTEIVRNVSSPRPRR